MIHHVTKTRLFLLTSRTDHKAEVDKSSLINTYSCCVIHSTLSPRLNPLGPRCCCALPINFFAPACALTSPARSDHSSRKPNAHRITSHLIFSSYFNPPTRVIHFLHIHYLCRITYISYLDSSNLHLGYSIYRLLRERIPQIHEYNGRWQRKEHWWKGIWREGF